MTKSSTYYATSFIWGVIAKSSDAIIRFITTPLLLLYFGKDSFGLLSLALSINVYTNLLDMGMNTGSIKYFSQWINNKQYDLLNRVSQTSITFYLLIGLVNTLVFLSLAISPNSIFNINTEQIHTFQILMIILAISSIFNWGTFVFNQLLIAKEKIGLVQKVFIFRSLFLLVITGITIQCRWSIEQYFVGYILVNCLIIIPYYIYCKRMKLISSVLPAFHWKEFSVILKYSLAIFSIGIFQLTATQSRPIVLGIFSTTGMDILSDYKVIEVFPAFIISIGGMLISIFLPKSSKYIADNSRKQIEALAYKGTLYTSIITSVMCFLVIVISKELLIQYVGYEYAHLHKWLSMWIFTLTLYLHNSPISSLVLASGRTKALVYNTAFSCVISIIINIVLCKTLDVGSAVVGYLVYIIIQMLFYYLYFNRKILYLNSWKVFRSFIVPTGLAIIATISVIFMDIQLQNIIMQMIIKVSIWLSIYFILIFSFRVVTLKEIKQTLDW